MTPIDIQFPDYLKYSKLILGVNIEITIPKVHKSPIIMNNSGVKLRPSMDNNKRKFAFLASETKADYRPKSVIIEKEQKTTTNQSTKFQQLQQLFNNIGGNHEPMEADVILRKEIGMGGGDIFNEKEVRYRLHLHAIKMFGWCNCSCGRLIMPNQRNCDW